jgi:RNase P protein component
MQLVDLREAVLRDRIKRLQKAYFAASQINTNDFELLLDVRERMSNRLACLRAELRAMR